LAVRRAVLKADCWVVAMAVMLADEKAAWMVERMVDGKVERWVETSVAVWAGWWVAVWVGLTADPWAGQRVAQKVEVLALWWVGR
jgi:hypothetical protein